jgi:hypothetical protein
LPRRTLERNAEFVRGDPERHWNTPATVTVTGVDDTVHDGNQMYRIRVGPAVSRDPAFDGVQNSVSVTNLDDD